jgi:hypothetical protein
MPAHLQVPLGVPVTVVQDHGVCRLQVQAKATTAGGRQENGDLQQASNKNITFGCKKPQTTRCKEIRCVMSSTNVQGTKLTAPWCAQELEPLQE